MKRSALPVGIAVLVAAVLLLHRAVPNTGWHLGSLLEAFLPWLGLAVLPLFALAVYRRSWLLYAAAALPLAAWLGVFGAQALPAGGGRYDLVVAQHNVSDENPDPVGTARTLVAAHPDLIGVEEITPEAAGAYASVLDGPYPYHFMNGTVALWSRFPLRDAARLDIKPRTLDSGWERALRAVAQTPAGDVAVYVVHLPSIRIKKTKGFDSTWRDDSAAQLGAVLRAEQQPRVVLIGDLNSTVQDRALRPVTSQLSWAASGFAWSFPAAFPVARVDQIMARPAQVTGVWTLPRTGSDHLPIAARIRW